ncbi:hypothetical protein GA0074694_0047 [Micromonospora inyonensis]|uniref:Uncharacterized protein n=1 Tax=Micromonospora inyonensis TaxID=47866 RepID=A0A1C6R775_9ACTN|nr:hypothetical protein GA0074694_0047 [Micromonospora inyonensis]
MASTKRQRQRERRALGHAKQASEPTEGAVPPKPANWPCERCGEGCRTDKPVYGWVCANCAYELDRYLMVHMGMTGGAAIEVYESAKRRGELPPPGPRGLGVNVRKP